ARSASPSGFAIAPGRAAPRKVMRAGTNAIEAIFKFETRVARGSGIIRLIPDVDDGNRLKAWTLLTELGELKGFEEQLGVNHLRYLHFPPTWPTYIPKDKLANWFETYVEAMELNFWTETEFEGSSYDEHQGHWTVTLRCADGSKRTMHPHHVVLATGVSGIPSVPD